MSCVGGGGIRKEIDFDILKGLIPPTNIVEGKKERYQFTWPDKNKAMALVNQEITSTLRPCKDESLNFDTTENLYIEGDNLEVLKLLQETYLGKIKMIYIDPPYNTGNDFVYKDNFSQSAENYQKNSGQQDEEGNCLVLNKESEGRFHTNWLNMMYPRLRLAKDLLAEDGVIFISIDDNEQANLRKICDEIFGERNFIAQIVWERSFAPISLKKHFSVNHDYIVCFSKNINQSICKGLPRTDGSLQRYSNPDNDPRGPWQSDNSTVGPAIQEKIYEITLPSGRRIMPPSGRCWLYTESRFKEMIDDNRIWFGSNGDNVPRVKRFLSEVKVGLTPMTIWKFSEVGHSQEASQRLKELFSNYDIFDYPKPVNLIQRCIDLYCDGNSIILDFFSGSATTAHAVMKLNAEDGGKRKFIMVQLPEECKENSEAYRAGYKNICDIGKERIRRAGKQILEERSSDFNDLFADNSSLDVGFRVLKLDSSNMEDVYYTPDETDQKNLDHTISNIKNGRTSEDLLFQVMLDLGILLSSKIKEENIAGKKVFNVEDNYLIACFEHRIDESVIIEVAKKKPTYFVIKDSSLANDSVSVNFDQIFARYSPDTIRKVL